MKNALGIVALASCVIAECRAAPPPRVPENLLTCRKLQDEGERVRCYDAQIDALTSPAAAASTQTATPSAPTAAPTAPRNAPTSAAAKFGEELLPANSRPTPPEKEIALLASITEVKTVGPKTYVISLSNGQVWRQEGAQITAFFRVGDDARIEKGALGSYRMSTAAAGSKNWVRVTRIQ